MTLATIIDLGVCVLLAANFVALVRISLQLRAGQRLVAEARDRIRRDSELTERQLDRLTSAGEICDHDAHPGVWP